MNLVDNREVDVSTFLVSGSVRDLEDLAVGVIDTDPLLVPPCVLLFRVNHEPHCVNRIIENICLRVVVGRTDKICTFIADNCFRQCQSGASLRLCVLTCNKKHALLEPVNVFFSPGRIDIHLVGHLEAIDRSDERFLP